MGIWRSGLRYPVFVRRFDDGRSNIFDCDMKKK